MKRKLSLALVIAFVLCITGFSFPSHMTFRHIRPGSLQVQATPKTAHTYQLTKKRLTSFHSLTADLKDIDLKLKPSNDKNYYLSYNLHCYDSTNPLTYEIKNGTLYLKGSNAQWAPRKIKKGNYTYMDTSTLVTIYVPSTALEEIKLNSGYGDMVIQKISFKNGAFTTTYGNISIAGVKNIQKLHAKTVDGDVILLKLSISNNLELLTTHYGNISTDNTAISGTAKLNTADGDIILYNADIPGSLQLTTHYGDVNAFNLILSGKAALNTDYGDMNLQINDKSLKRLGISATTKYGDLSVSKNVDGRKKRYKENGYRYEKTASPDGACLDVATMYGDVYLQ